MAISTKALVIGLIIGLVIGGATSLFVKPREIERVAETVLGPAVTEREMVTETISLTKIVTKTISGPTETVTKTVTPTPTPTPTPIPVKEPEILSHTSYIDTIGYFTVVGEIRNNLETNINYVKIVATFYDAENKVIGTSFTFTDLEILKLGQKSPFELSSFPEKISPANYKLTLSYDLTGEEPFQGLVILSHTASFDSLGYHQVVGEVGNNGNRKSTHVKVVCTYYDLKGVVIGKSFTFTDPDEIDIGETAPFKLSSYPNKISPASCELQVEGS